ncbi:MAG: hypothetical protein ABI308_16555 [Mucilaginibacter sp.]
MEPDRLNSIRLGDASPLAAAAVIAALKVPAPISALEVTIRSSAWHRQKPKVALQALQTTRLF